MNLSWVMYRRLVDDMVRALRAAQRQRVRTYHASTVDVPALRGQQSRGSVLWTPRQAELLPRPGAPLTSTRLEARAYALGDGRRVAFGAGIVPGGFGLPDEIGGWGWPPPEWLQVVMPEPPVFDERVGVFTAGLAHRRQGAWSWSQFPQSALVPQPDPLPAAGGITMRRILGHHPRWELDWAWLNADRVEPAAYGSALIDGERVVQGLLRPYWNSLATEVGSGLPLPVELREPAGGGDDEPHVDLFHAYRSLADVGEIEEKGELPFGEGFGLIFFPDREIRCTIHITPPHVTIYPGGDYEERETEYWWQVGSEHQGPTGAENTEEEGMDGGIQVNAHAGTIGDFVTVEDVQLPTARVGTDGVAHALGEIEATRYTFTPPGVGLDEADKDWLYEGEWAFERDITVGPADRVICPSGMPLRAISPTCRPLTSYEDAAGTTTMRVEGTEFVKDYEDGDENNNQPDQAFLVQPNPNDSDTWYWVNCVIHVGDYIVMSDPGAPDLIAPHEGDMFNAVEDNHQVGLIVDVQPTAAITDDDWTLTFAHPVRRYNPNYVVQPYTFSMPPRYFGDSGSSRTFTVKTEIELKVRTTMLLRPGTAIYADYGASVETNWIDRGYFPDPQTAWFVLMHTPGYEIDVFHRQTVSGAHMTTSTRTQQFRTAYPIMETEGERSGIDLEDPVYQHVQLLVPCDAAFGMRHNFGMVRIGDRHPYWDEAYALWNMGLGRGMLRFRRPPYSFELPDADYHDPECNVPPLPYVDTENAWPMCQAAINNAGWDRPVEDPHVHTGSSNGPPEPLTYHPIQRRDRYLMFNGHAVAHVLHPPNIEHLDGSDGTQNPHVRAYHEQCAPTIYEGDLGELRNPLALQAHEGGGTWCGIQIPTRWYSADALQAPNGDLLGVVLAWHEDREGQPDEFMLHASRNGNPTTPQSVFHYFPDAIVGGFEQPATSVAGWPGSVYPKVRPGYSFLALGWPLGTARIAPFAVRAATSDDVPGVMLSRQFVGTPIVALAVNV